MKTISFTGKSGTGKSYQATALAQRRGFDAIIDDGLLIYKGQIVAGTSAKKCKTKAAAMRAALFNVAEQKDAVVAAIEEHKPNAIMIIGTSDRMTDIIASQLGIGAVEERIYIEDVSTEEDRKQAAHHRIDEGEHLIPAPMGQLRRDFAGYFMNPLKLIRDMALGTALDVDSGSKGKADDTSDERTVVRPTFSYSGTFEISEQVIKDIIKIAARKYSPNLVVVDRMSNGKPLNMSVTIDVRVIRSAESIDGCMAFQKDVYETISRMTAFTIENVNVRICDIARDYRDLVSAKLHGQ
ncbi:MAG: hypothetical protein IKE52_03635 [Mogibacterium sp.]|nr:hypothetical protein [Mogibacterium sp.]